MNETIKFTEAAGTRHSKWTFLSNASGLLCSTLIGAVQGFTFFYYESVIGLRGIYIFLAMFIFMIYNGVNDPIIGFLVDRNMRFTRKWGRRFPWIAIGIVPWVFSIYLLFSVPNIDVSTNPLGVFGWLLLTLVLLDTFGTLVNINYSALRLDKFQTEYERRRFTKYYAPLDIVAILLGMLLPTLFIDPSNSQASYALMGGVAAVVALIFALLSLPGNREDKIMIDRYFSPDYVKRMKFFKALVEAVKTKSFMVWFIFGTCLGIQITLVVVNAWYLTTFVLVIPDGLRSLAYLGVLGLNLIGTLVSIPIWLRYIRKINNNKKALVVAGLASCAALFPLTFFVGLIDLLIMAFILGLAQGGLNSYVYTIIGPSVTEDVIVKTGKNQKGVLFGISALLGRLVASIDELIIAVLHDTTGYIPGKETYSEMLLAVTAAGGNINLVLIGIRLLQGVIPALVLLLGVLVIWKFFPITQEKLLSNKAKMKELGF
ncbi:MAG: MFS transporter [Promethearchaeota archaeon]|jgi:GPH family glycoside/pentoside/hexuronide:cation symporter